MLTTDAVPGRGRGPAGRGKSCNQPVFRLLDLCQLTIALKTILSSDKYKTGGEMPDSSFQVYDRRRGIGMPAVPFRDSNGLTIYEDRRKTPDRRLNNAQAEWVNELLLSY